MSLTAERVFKNFGGVAALVGARIAVEPGSITGLIGPNGAGKSTLFNVITGFLKPTRGVIHFKGQDVTDLAPHKFPQLGVVRTFQIAREFYELTVLDNMLLGALDNPGESIIKSVLFPSVVKEFEERNRERAAELLEFLNLTRVTNELAKNLSGGQKKLLEIGRALMTDPTYLLLDEPFAGVNPTLVEELIKMLRDLQSQGITILVIEHNIRAVAALSDVLYVMADGQTLTHGNPAKVLADERVLEAYLGSSEAAFS